MFRVRLHGRGGQGIKSAGQVLGSAFFRAGFEVQDAPRYGAERRGAPISAYVRAARTSIQERGVITDPDLVVVADETLLPVPAAGVLQGLDAHTTMLICSGDPAEAWSARLQLAGPVLTLPLNTAIDNRSELPLLGATCAGAAARLTGAIRREDLAHAVRQETAQYGESAVAASLERALHAFDRMQAHAGCIREGSQRPAAGSRAPQWVDLPVEAPALSAPDVHVPASSEQADTGVWRTFRPVIDYARCNRCSWVCSTLCPDSAIEVDADHTPRIDYDHCKGCMVCVAVCPPHAIEAQRETR